LNSVFSHLNRLLFISILFSTGSALADFEAGEQAYQNSDKKTAFKEYHAAALDKDKRAYGKLGGLYLYGVGTEKNYYQAYIWFHMAHLTGDRDAERFRDAASSTMTREEYNKVLESAEQQRIKQKLNKITLQPKAPVAGRHPSL
jgi:hypothetical protein